MNNMFVKVIVDTIVAEGIDAIKDIASEYATNYKVHRIAGYRPIQSMRNSIAHTGKYFSDVLAGNPDPHKIIPCFTFNDTENME